jgi:hypothetical protein
LSRGELHRLQIAVKKQRDAIEFFAGLSTHQRSRGYIRSLTKPQEILKMNDIATAEWLLGELRSYENHAAVQEAAGIILGSGACGGHAKSGNYIGYGNALTKLFHSGQNRLVAEICFVTSSNMAVHLAFEGPLIDRETRIVQRMAAAGSFSPLSKKGQRTLTLILSLVAGPRTHIACLDQL